MRFEPDRTFPAKLQAQPEFQSAMHGFAVRVKRAVEIYSLGFRRTGYYLRNLRATGNRVEARDPFWHLIEYGSANNPAYAPLRRGVIAAGLRLVSRQK